MDRSLSFVEIDSVSAQEALRAGMVNHVVPLEELHEFALRLARFAARAADRSDRPVGVAAGQACRQPHDGHHGLLQRDRIVFRHAPPRHTRALAATAGRTVVMADLNRMKAAGRPE